MAVIDAILVNQFFIDIAGCLFDGYTGVQEYQTEKFTAVATR
jgi:hypothetical protein